MLLHFLSIPHVHVHVVYHLGWCVYCFFFSKNILWRGVAFCVRVLAPMHTCVVLCWEGRRCMRSMHTLTLLAFILFVAHVGT